MREARSSLRGMATPPAREFLLVAARDDSDADSGAISLDAAVGSGSEHSKSKIVCIASSDNGASSGANGSPLFYSSELRIAGSRRSCSTIALPFGCKAMAASSGIIERIRAAACIRPSLGPPT